MLALSVGVSVLGAGAVVGAAGAEAEVLALKGLGGGPEAGCGAVGAAWNGFGGKLLLAPAVLAPKLGPLAGVGVRRLLSQSSKKDDPPAGGGVGAVAGAGLCHGPLGAPKLLATGLGSGLVAMRSKISFSTLAFGLPYLAAESCLSASASLEFGVPSAGKVAILNGWVGTPPISVRTMVL